MPDAAGNKKMLFTRTKHHAFAVHLNRPGGEGTRVTPKRSEWANRRNMARAAWLQIKKKPGARIGSGPCLYSGTKKMPAIGAGILAQVKEKDRSADWLRALPGKWL